MDRVIGVGLDSTELGIDSASHQPAYDTAATAGFRLTAHQGKNSPPAAIATCLDVLGMQRIDHVLSLLDDPALTDLDLGREYAAVAEAFDRGWHDMVQIAVDGVEACWLDDTDKARLRQQITTAADALTPTTSG